MCDGGGSTGEGDHPEVDSIFVLFCFVLFCFVLFCFVLFFVLFCFVLFCFVFCFVVFDKNFNNFTTNNDKKDSNSIDIGIVDSLGQNVDQLLDYNVLSFVPFDQASKKTLVELKTVDGKVFRAAKGAPNVLLEMTNEDLQTKHLIEQKIADFASQGKRVVGTFFSFLKFDLIEEKNPKI